MILTDFIEFLRHPSKELKKEKIFFRRLLIFFMCLIIGLLGLVLISLIISFLSYLGVDKEVFTHNNIFKERIKDNSNFWSIVVLAPIIEEISFRLHLTGRRHYVFISFFSILYLAVNFYINTVLNTDVNVWFLRSLFLLVLIVCYFTFKTKKKQYFNNSLSFKITFYFTAFLFALFHLSNFYPLSLQQMTFFPLLILPQFFYGISFGYIRLKNGFIWAVVLHSFVNFIGFSIFFIFRYFVNHPVHL